MAKPKEPVEKKAAPKKMPPTAAAPAPSPDEIDAAPVAVVQKEPAEKVSDPFVICRTGYGIDGENLICLKKQKIILFLDNYKEPFGDRVVYTKFTHTFYFDTNVTGYFLLTYSLQLAK